MTFEEISTMLKTVGVPTAYRAFAEESGQQPPFIVFYYDSSRDVYADDANYQRIERMYVELYTDDKDFGMESAVEGVLTENGLTWTREETYIDSEKMYEVIYQMDVVITTTVTTEGE